MAISDDEAAQLIDHIGKTVREVAGQAEMQGIINLMAQWRSDVEAGRPIERKLSVRRSPGLDELADVPRSRKMASGDFVGKEDYSKVEQLDMLVAALSVAFIAPQMMAKRLLDTIMSCGDLASEDFGPSPVVHLVGIAGPDDTEATPLLSYETITQSRGATMPLARLLREITSEAELKPRNLDDEEEVV